MKHSSQWFTASRLIFCCCLVSLALSHSVGASGAGTPSAGNLHQEVELRKESSPSYDSNTSYEKTPFENSAQALSDARSSGSNEQQLKREQALQKQALQKQMATLLQENAEIQRQRLQLLEAGKQRLLWAQVLVAVLVISILAALAYFWHLHARNLMNRGMNAISNTLSHFQDSLLQFVDTSELAANSSVSSFALTQNTQLVHDHEPQLERHANTNRRQSNDLGEQRHTTPAARRNHQAPRTTNISRDYFVEELELPPVASQQPVPELRAEHGEAKPASANTPASVPPAKPDEFFAVKGYVDSWLRIYKPSEQSDTGIRLTPPDPLIELAKKEAESLDDGLAFDRDANKMQARSGYKKPVGYKTATSSNSVTSGNASATNVSSGNTSSSNTSSSNTKPSAVPIAQAANASAASVSKDDLNSAAVKDVARAEGKPTQSSSDADESLETSSLSAAEPIRFTHAKKKPSSPRELLSQLEHCRANNDPQAYERVYREIKKFFNLKLEPWEMLGSIEQKQLSDFPHVINKILELWSSDEIVTYLERLLGNSRINPRQGFDLAIYEKLEGLLVLARTQDRPRDLQQLKKLDTAAFLFVPLPSTKKTEAITSKSSARSALQIDASLSYEQNTPAKPSAKLEAVITPEFGALDHFTGDENTVQTQVNRSHIAASKDADSVPAMEVPTLPEASLQARKLEAERQRGGHDDKFMLSPFEVRIKLAVAYTEMGDHEGAILLLEEVMQDAPLSQRKHAERLIREIEVKKTALADRMINHAAQSTESLER